MGRKRFASGSSLMLIVALLVIGCSESAGGLKTERAVAVRDVIESGEFNGDTHTTSFLKFSVTIPASWEMVENDLPASIA